MRLERARILKAHDAPCSQAVTREMVHPDLARTIPGAIVDAHRDGEQIIARAREEAASILENARTNAVELADQTRTDAREREMARLAAKHLTVRAFEAQTEERSIARTTELAVLLAERLLGEALRLDPDIIVKVAAEVLREARGARRIRIDVHPNDMAALSAALAPLDGAALEINTSADLGPGSVLVHTDVGTIDGRLSTQLSRLADALREALRT